MKEKSLSKPTGRLITSAHSEDYIYK